MQIVTRTSRIGLAAPMQNLQGVIHDIQDLKFNGCLKESADYLGRAADTFYKGMLDFMANKTFDAAQQDRVSNLTNWAVDEGRKCKASVTEAVAAAQAKDDEVHKRIGR